MKAVESEILRLLGESVQHLSDLVQNLGDRLETVESVLQALNEPITSAISAGGVANIFTGMLLAELADGDQNRFDEIMARTTTYAEMTAGGLDEPVRSVLLSTMDTAVSIADDHFARNHRVG